MALAKVRGQCRCVCVCVAASLTRYFDELPAMAIALSIV